MGKFKNFMLKQAMKAKMKDIPEEQQQIILNLVEKNPDFFKMIGEEVKKKTKGGMSETAATMQVMREHQGEFQKLMR
ncbi:MAG: hypothetical protein ABIF06_01255 [bacterium]